MLARFWRWLVMSHPVVYVNQGEPIEHGRPAGDRVIAEHRDDLLDFIPRRQEPTP